MNIQITSDLQHEQAFKRYMKNIKKCKFCNKNIPYEKRRNIFCNHSCAASFNNKNVRRHGKNPGNCLVCNKKLNWHQEKFCSRKCFQVNRWNNYKKIVEKEKRFPAKKAGSNSSVVQVKRYLSQKFGHKCSICKIEHWRGEKVPLVLDHIDGNAENWDVHNCRLVCRNCDGQLPTFAGRNKGKGSKYRYMWRKNKGQSSRGLG